MLYAILFSFLWAAVAPWIVRAAGRQSGWVLALGPLGLFAYFLRFLPEVAAGTVVRTSVAWVPQLGVEASILLDGLALLFALLITGLGAIVVAYAGRYLEGHRDLGRFYLSLLAFLGAMLGLVLADNLILLFVFWEMTSLCSYLLIGFKHEGEKSRKAALQALLVTGGGGLALLGGLLLLGVAGSAWELSALLAAGDLIREHLLYGPIFILVALGAFTKSAQVPFHFWLPGAMAAPTPVSAYLHSATMVKAGVYLLARFDPILGGTGLWVWTLALVGGTTMLVGAVGALRNTDLKSVLAYSTITALGTLVVLLGLSYDASIKAAVVFLLVHAFYKSGLFLVAGSVDHATGTRDVLRLGGLRRAMPWTALAAVLAGLSMAGLPPLFGFVGKELAYKAKLGVDNLGWMLPAIAVLANALTVVAASVLVARPFFGRARRDDAEAHAETNPAPPHAPHEVAPAMWVGPVVVGVLGLVFGAYPGVLYGLVAPAVDAVAGGPAEVKLAAWYGVNTALGLSILTVVLGVVGSLAWPTLHRLVARAGSAARLGPKAAYEAGLDALLRIAAWQTRFFEGGSVRVYLGATFAVTGALVGGTLLAKGALADPLAAAWGDLQAMPYEWALAGVVAAAALVATQARDVLTGVAVLGVVGFGIALLFVLGSAPDLAMTQFLVEILVVVILLLVVQRLPQQATNEPRRHRIRDAGIALGVGATVTTLLLAVVHVPLDTTVPQYFLERAVPDGFGRNVVNVILVDFRALDTLGEIAVLAVAALGAFVLLKFGRPDAATAPSNANGADPTFQTARRSRRTPPTSVHGVRSGVTPSLVLQTGTRLLLTLLVMGAFFMLWRGHNEPGGGFIGGLLASAAVVLYLVAYGQTAAERMLRLHPRTLLGTGLALAVGSGLIAMLAGEAFMTGQWTALGAVKLGTPLLFDVGVFLVVIGFVLTIVFALERVTAPPASSDARVPAHTDAPPSPVDSDADPASDAPHGDGHPRVKSPDKLPHIT